MVYRSHRILWLAKLLPANARQSAIILQVRVPAQNRALELGRGHLAEFLSECALWSKLEL